MHVAYGRSSDRLWQGDEITMGRGSFGGFLPHWECIVQHSIWNPYKNGRTDQGSVWDDEWSWPVEQGVRGDDPQRGSGNFGENHVPDKLNTRLIVNWTDPCSIMHTIYAWLEVLDESIIGREGVGMVLHTAGEVWCLRLACCSCYHFVVEDGTGVRADWFPFPWVIGRSRKDEVSGSSFLTDVNAELSLYSTIQNQFVMCRLVQPKTAICQVL